MHDATPKPVKPALPLCPNCCKPFGFVRVDPRAGERAALYIFECKTCRISLMQAEDEGRTAG